MESSAESAASVAAGPTFPDVPRDEPLAFPRDHGAHPSFRTEWWHMTGWLKNGQVKYQETILDGFERAPEGLIGLFSGLNSGKMLIRVAD